MYAKIILIISIFKVIDCFYLEAASNYLKPKLERNNIVNKGIWVRNKLQEDLFEKNNLGNFIFRPNSVDADHVMQNNFDAFGDNAMQETPFVSNYVQRTRRSPDHIRKRRPRKSMKAGKFIKNSIEDSIMIKSKIVSDLKPSSVFNEYPYEVAILLNNGARKVINHTHEKEHHKKESNKTSPEIISENNQDAIKEDKFEVVPLNANASVSSDTVKRSKKYNVMYDNMDNEIYNYNMVEKQNKTELVTTANKQDRAVFNKDKIVNWNPQVSKNNIYKIVPKEPPQPKSVTERGLVKIISMLTKTFKKITKQHTEIKDIHDKLINTNQNFDNKVAELTSKFEDFDSKYSDMIQFNDKIKAFESQLNSQKDYFDLKQKEIQKSFTEFQDQQKNFLTQQRQFYGIQKLMLAQNEKINAKQTEIAKTQSQISHRQNNFARILKKAKQIIDDNKTKVVPIQSTEQDKYKSKLEKDALVTTPVPNTQAMKINLFSIPTKDKLQNQDALIIKEKDDKQIDDLVYKYYFNNTFIDTLMKSKILNNYVGALSNTEIVNRSKQSKLKRDDLETTLMLPVNNSLSDSPGKRDRRWINHFSKNKYWKANRNKRATTAYPKTTTNLNKIRDDASQTKHTGDLASERVNKVKNDPFLTMATNFCNEIGQNTNEQVLKWCVEKALRRLKFMEVNTFTPPPVTVMMETSPNEKQADKSSNEISTLSAVPMPAVLLTETQVPNTYEPVVAKVTPMYAVSDIPTANAQEIFFPDNDELESNLKQYELKPDTEGNVYYEGSLHISDYGQINSGATSDIMPGLMDSNSKVDIDPMTFDIQAKRRAYVRRINENILKQMKAG